MFGEFKIQAGDFDTIRKGMFSGGGGMLGGMFSMPKKDAWTAMERYPADQVESLEVASEEAVKRIGGTAGWGLAGAALLGPVGLLAGLIIGGKGKDVTFIVKFKDGKKALCTANSKIYTKMHTAMM